MPFEHWLDVAQTQIQPALCVQKTLELFRDYFFKNHDVQRFLNFYFPLLRHLYFKLLYRLSW